MNSQEKYKTLGVSADKAGLHSALETSGLKSSDNHFASVIDASEQNYSFLHCDGAGTKSVAAYLAYKESRDPKYFAGLAQDALVMNLDDVYCLGPVGNLTLANLIGRNAKNIPDEVLEVLFSSYKELCENLESSSEISIKLAGGETADCGDIVRTLMVDAVLSGEIAKEKTFDLSKVPVGSVIVGLSSTGKASYESEENSGIGSNGLTLARHALIKPEYQAKYREICDDGAEPCVGKLDLFDKIPGSSLTVADGMLSPTRTYAPVLKEVYSRYLDKISGVIHNTGGAHTKASKFITSGSIEKDLQEIPPIFKLIQSQAEIDWQEMYKVFNMGIRMELYTNTGTAAEIIKIAADLGIDASEIGEVKQRAEHAVLLKTPNGEYKY